MRTHYDTEQNFWAAAATFLIIAALLISAWAVDSHGRQANNHTEPLPEQVTRLDGYSYLMPMTRDPNTVCKVGSTQTVRPVKRLDVTYVECNLDQTWNDKREASPNYGESLGRVLTAPWFYGPAGLLLLASLVPIAVESRRVIRNRRATKRQTRITAETKRDELAAAYARGTIDDIEYEQGLERIFPSLKRSV